MAMEGAAGTPVMQDQIAAILQGLSTTMDSKIAEKIAEVKSEILDNIAETAQKLKDEIGETIELRIPPMVMPPDLDVLNKNLDVLNQNIVEIDTKIQEVQNDMKKLVGIDMFDDSMRMTAALVKDIEQHKQAIDNVQAGNINKK